MEDVDQVRNPFEISGTYEIHVVGALNVNWSEWLAGMSITVVRPTDDDALPMSVLTGWLPDQAALNGVLNTLYDRHFAVRYVSILAQREQLQAGDAP